MVSNAQDLQGIAPKSAPTKGLRKRGQRARTSIEKVLKSVTAELHSTRVDLSNYSCDPYRHPPGSQELFDKNLFLKKMNSNVVLQSRWRVVRGLSKRSTIKFEVIFQEGFIRFEGTFQKSLLWFERTFQNEIPLTHGSSMFYTIWGYLSERFALIRYDFPESPIRCIPSLHFLYNANIWE